MSPLEKILADIHPEARVVSVETDEHEHRDTVCCGITKRRLFSDEQLAEDSNGQVVVTVARIQFEAPGYGREYLSESESEWLPISQEALDEAEYLATGTIEHGLLVDEIVAQTHAQALKRDGFTDVRIVLADGRFRICSSGKGRAA